MQQETNKKIRQGLLLSQLDDIYATVLRQAYFVRFEKIAHEMTAGGCDRRPTRTDLFRRAAAAIWKGRESPEEFQWEWLTIPHILRVRSTAMRTVSAISWSWPCIACISRKVPTFVPKYLDLLATGGSLLAGAHSRCRQRRHDLEEVLAIGVHHDPRDDWSTRSHPLTSRATTSLRNWNFRIYSNRIDLLTRSAQTWHTENASHNRSCREALMYLCLCKGINDSDVRDAGRAGIVMPCQIKAKVRV